MTKVEINNSSGGGGKIIAILIVIILAIGCICGYLFNYGKKYKQKYRNEKDNTSELSKTISSLSDSCKTYRIKCADGMKRSVGQTNALAMSEDNIKKLQSDKLSLIKKLGIRTDELRSITSAVITTKDSVQAPVYVDSIHSLHVDYTDGYLTLNNTIYRNLDATVRYEYRDSFDLINDIHYKRFLFFKFKKHTNRFFLIPKNTKSKVLDLKVVERII